MAWLSFLLVAGFVQAAPSERQCANRELRRKDCLLKQSVFQVQLSKLKVTWNNGTWTSIADMPMTDDAFQWEKMELEKISGRLILQMWIWDAGKGEAKVQSLHWLAAEMKDRKFSVLLDQIVRKREVRATKTGTYSYDKMAPHKLTVTRGGIKWSVGHQNGVI